jgi:hypothetical protein
VRKLSILLVVSALLGAAFSSSQAQAFPRHKCGSFVYEDTWEDGSTTRLRIAVYNSDHLACRVATKVIKAFFGPEDQIKSHGGSSQVQTYYTIEGLPGWRCYTGAGGGGCVHRGKLAAYLSHLL